MTEVDLRSVTGDTLTVLLNRRVSKVPAVTIDNADGIRQAVAHLQALGHHRVGYVAGPRTSWSNKERLRGLRAATTAAGLDLIEVGAVAPTFAGGVAAADLVLSAGVTAVFAYNDLIALGLLNRFRSKNVAVPGDISVISVDDIMFSEMVSPSLTTLAQPKEQLGRVGVDLLLQVAAGRRPERRRAPHRHLATGHPQFHRNGTANALTCRSGRICRRHPDERGAPSLATIIGSTSTTSGSPPPPPATAPTPSTGATTRPPTSSCAPTPASPAPG